MLSAALRQVPRGTLAIGGVALLVAGLWFFVYLPDARYFDLVPTYAAGHLWLEGEWDAIYQLEIWLCASAGDARGAAKSNVCPTQGWQTPTSITRGTCCSCCR